MGYLSKLLRGAGTIFVMGIFIAALGYLVRVVLARKLSPEEFGLFFAVYNVILLLNWIKGFGFGPALQKFLPEFRVKKQFSRMKSSFVFVALFTLIVSGVIFLLAVIIPQEIFTSYFKSVDGKIVFLLLMFYIMIDSISQALSSFFLSVYKFFSFHLRDFITRVCVVLGALLLVNGFIDNSVIYISLLYILGTIISLLVNLYFFLRIFPFFRYKTRITPSFIKKMVRFSVPLVIQDAFSVIMARVDSLLLVFFRPLVEVAIYNVITPTADMLLLLSRPFGRIMFPLTSELYTVGKKEKITLFLRNIHKHLLLLLIPALVALFLFGQFILETFFGAQYGVGAIGLDILAFGLLFSSLNIVSYSVLLGIGKPKEATKATILANVLNAAMNLMLIPLFGKFDQGYVGAIIATTLSSITLFFALTFYLQRFVAYRFPWQESLSVLLTALVFGGMSWYIVELMTSVFLKIIAFVSLTILLYPSLLFIIRLTSIRELQNLFKILLNRNTKKQGKESA